MSFFALGHPLGSWKSLKNDVFIYFFEFGRHKEASRELWGHLGDEKVKKTCILRGLREGSLQGSPKESQREAQGIAKDFKGLSGGPQGPQRTQKRSQLATLPLCDGFV